MLQESTVSIQESAISSISYYFFLDFEDTWFEEKNQLKTETPLRSLGVFRRVLIAEVGFDSLGESKDLASAFSGISGLDSIWDQNPNNPAEIPPIKPNIILDFIVYPSKLKLILKNRVAASPAIEPIDIGDLSILFHSYWKQ